MKSTLTLLMIVSVLSAFSPQAEQDAPFDRADSLPQPAVLAPADFSDTLITYQNFLNQ